MLNLFFFFFVSFLITVIIFVATYLVNNSDQDYDKKSAYECGFEPFGDARSFFDVQFYVIGLLFVVFDLEVVFLIPAVSDVENISLFGYLNVLLFLAIVVLGFYYEWSLNLLDWASEQRLNLLSKKNFVLFLLSGPSFYQEGLNVNGWIFFCPEFVLLFTFLCVLFLNASYRLNLHFLRLFLLGGFKVCMFSLILTIFLLSKKSYQIFFFNSMYQISIWTQCLKILIVGLVLFFIYFLSLTLRPVSTNSIILFALLVFFSFVAFSCRLFPLLLVALEGVSLISYFMAMAEKTYGGLAAATKYFIMGTLGSVFLFWSVVQMYYMSASLRFEDIFEIARSTYFSEAYVEVESFSRIFVIGVLIKLGAAPFHYWIPDNYTGVSLYTNMIFATLTKTIFFFAFFEILLKVPTTILLKLSMFLSLIVGCYFSLRQNELRRLIAYSSIVHTAFLLAGDAASSIIYILTYLASSIFFFLILIEQQTIENTEILWLNCLNKRGNWSNSSLFCFTVSLLSMAGLPPFAGFFGKYSVWVSLLENYYIYFDIYSFIFFITSIFFSLMIIFYYFRVILNIFVKKNISYHIDTLLPPRDLLEWVNLLNFSKLLLGFFVTGWVLFENLLLTLVLSLLASL